MGSRAGWGVPGVGKGGHSPSHCSGGECAWSRASCLISRRRSTLPTPPPTSPQASSSKHAPQPTPVQGLGAKGGLLPRRDKDTESQSPSQGDDGKDTQTPRQTDHKDADHGKGGLQGVGKSSTAGCGMDCTAVERELYLRVQNVTDDLKRRLGKLREHSLEHSLSRSGAVPFKSSKAGRYVEAVRAVVFEEVAAYTSVVSVLGPLLLRNYRALPAAHGSAVVMQQRLKICRLLQLLRDTAGTAIKQARWALVLDEDAAFSMVQALRLRMWPPYDLLLAGNPWLQRSVESSSQWLSKGTHLVAALFMLAAASVGVALGTMLAFGASAMGASWAAAGSMSTGALAMMAIQDAGQEMTLKLSSTYVESFIKLKARLQKARVVSIDALLDELEWARACSLKYEQFLHLHEEYGICSICLSGFYVHQTVVFSGASECGKFHKFHQACLHEWCSAAAQMAAASSTSVPSTSLGPYAACPCCRRPMSSLSRVQINSPFSAKPLAKKL